MKIETTEKLFTEKRIELKPNTLVYDSYSDAQNAAQSARSYFAPCFDAKGNYFGFYVAK